MSKPDDVFLFLEHEVILQITIEYKRRLTVTFFHLRLLHRCVNMSKVTYPRPCPHCRKLLNSRFSYCRHKAHCGKTKAKVQFLYCEKSFNRLDNCKRHMKNVHSEAAKRKAEDSAKLARLELLHSNKVPKLESDESQTGGAVSTRSMKQDKDKVDLKPTNDQPQSAEEEKISRGRHFGRWAGRLFGRASRAFRTLGEPSVQSQFDVPTLPTPRFQRCFEKGAIYRHI